MTKCWEEGLNTREGWSKLQYIHNVDSSVAAKMKEIQEG